MFTQIVNKSYVEKYAKQIETVDQFLKTADFSNVKFEEKTFISEDIFYLVKKYETKKCAEIKLENHEQMIDVHYALSGNERVVIARVEDMDTVSDYDSSTDCGWYTTSNDEVHSSVVIEEGEYLVLFPGEAHEPEIMDNSEVNTKVIFKIKM